MQTGLCVKGGFWRTIAHLKVCRLQSKVRFVQVGRQSPVILYKVERLELIHHLISSVMLLFGLRPTSLLLRLA